MDSPSSYDTYGAPLIRFKQFNIASTNTDPVPPISSTDEPESQNDTSTIPSGLSSPPHISGSPTANDRLHQSPSSSAQSQRPPLPTTSSVQSVESSHIPDPPNQNIKNPHKDAFLGACAADREVMANALPKDSDSYPSTPLSHHEIDGEIEILKYRQMRTLEWSSSEKLDFEAELLELQYARDIKDKVSVVRKKSLFGRYRKEMVVNMEAWRRCVFVVTGWERGGREVGRAEAERFRYSEGLGHVVLLEALLEGVVREIGR